MPSKWPGVIAEVDRERREIRVSIPPFTDGASELPIAEIEYPIGDDSQNTEIRMVVGRPVWISFIADDPRRPIITGFRNPNTGNEVGTRRWNHDNFEINADENHTLNAGNAVVIDAGQTVTINAGDTIKLVVGGATFTVTADTIAAIAATIKLN